MPRREANCQPTTGKLYKTSQPYKAIHQKNI
ncbi:hypothetical protein E2C01_098107 [Portunus trituberculatus]|uniref:Uncharacterized protein n=1 Tax=Portunus trituberculatus TaxID=210409 RepID=A0A5B7KBB2_PORTR|nr:hypothetical protein [Portunus trituberculatus]